MYIPFLHSDCSPLIHTTYPRFRLGYVEMSVPQFRGYVQSCNATIREYKWKRPVCERARCEVAVHVRSPSVSQSTCAGATFHTRHLHSPKRVHTDKYMWKHVNVFGGSSERRLSEAAASFPATSKHTNLRLAPRRLDATQKEQPIDALQTMEFRLCKYLVPIDAPRSMDLCTCTRT